MNKYLEKVALAVEFMKNLERSATHNRAVASNFNNKYLNALKPTLDKVNKIKDPWARTAVSTLHY